MVVGRVGGKGLLGEKNKGWGVVGNSGGFPGGGAVAASNPPRRI